MRIIAGELAGRALRGPRDDSTRPAMGRTREAIFSMLESRGMSWPGARVLDLFAGTGSLAFEALSRGAAYAAMVDNSDAACALLAKNADSLGVSDKCRIVKSDAARFLRGSPAQGFNLVFVDPPYRRNYAAACLGRLVNGDWLLPGAFVVAELEKNLKLEAPEALVSDGERLFGQTMVRIWRKA